MIRPDDDLLDRALDGMLDEDGERALALRLKGDPALARRLMELARDEALLAECASSARALTAGRGPARRLRAAIVAAAILLAALLWSLIPKAPHPGLELADVRGACLLRGRPARAGDRPAPGDRVATGGDGTALLRCGNGTTLRLGPSTEVDVSGPWRFHVAAGEVAAAVAPPPPGLSFIVSTPHAEARVVGTRFTLAASGSATRLSVEEGTVLLGSVPVGAGHFATTRAGIPPVALPLAGTGLRGEYFGGPDLADPRFSRIDPRIEFHWDSASPHPLLRTEAFSVRWTGRIVPRSTGTFAFHALTDDGLRLWVNGALVIDHWAQSTKTEKSGAAALEAWQPAEFRMEYMNAGGPATAVLSWSGPSTPKAVVPAEAFHPAPLEGAGLKGEYFDEMDFGAPKLTRVDPIVDYDWGLGAPHPSMDPDAFSVRWTGWVVPRHSERYTIHVESDDGVRLWIDGAPVIDDWAVRGTLERSGVLTLEGGRRHALRLEYFDRISTARVRLSWTSPSQPREVIPQSRLHPAP